VTTRYTFKDSYQWHHSWLPVVQKGLTMKGLTVNAR